MRDYPARLRLIARRQTIPSDEFERTLYGAADEIERLREALEEASEYAGRLAISLRNKHYSDLPLFELQPDLYGRLTQIDNMTCGMARAALEEKE